MVKMGIKPGRERFNYQRFLLQTDTKLHLLLRYIILRLDLRNDGIFSEIVITCLICLKIVEE